MTSQNPSLQIPHSPSSSRSENFDYGILDAGSQLLVQQKTHEIKGLMSRTARDIIDIGHRLIEVKQCLGHGYFIRWLEAEFSWGEWTARKFMQVAREFKSVNFTDLSVAISALYLLAASSTPEAARKEALERAKQGETITYLKAKSIVNQHRQTVQSQTASSVTLDVAAEASAETAPQPYPPTRSSGFFKGGIGQKFTAIAAESAPQKLIQTEASAAQPQAQTELPPENPNFVQPPPAHPVDKDSTSEPIRILRIQHRRQTSGKALETFSLTSRDQGIQIEIECYPPILISLFEQMQAHPQFIKEILQHARTLITKTRLENQPKTSS